MTGETVWVLDIVGYDARGGNADVFSSCEKAKAAVPHVKKWTEPDEKGRIAEDLGRNSTDDIYVIYKATIK